ncbi:MAG TPA: hypothetical protein VLW50_12790 [Streptosporangiaceae bacterium]|nr:hypothetical protein [Streptosporangiaceae bacterium]
MASAMIACSRLVAAHRFGGDVLNGDALAGRVGHGLLRPAAAGSLPLTKSGFGAPF